MHHLGVTPGEHVTHEGGAHHAQVDDHPDDPGDLAGGLVGAVEETAEDVDIDREEEQRCAVGVDVAQHVAAIHVAHDVLDAGEGQIDLRGVMHHQHDACDDLKHEAEGKHDAPDPPPVQFILFLIAADLF